MDDWIVCEGYAGNEIILCQEFEKSSTDNSAFRCAIFNVAILDGE